MHQRGSKGDSLLLRGGSSLLRKFLLADSLVRSPVWLRPWRVRAGRGGRQESFPAYTFSLPLPSADVAAPVQVTQHQRGAGEAVPDSTGREPLPFPGPPAVPALCRGGELWQLAGLWLRARCGWAQLRHEVSRGEPEHRPRTGLLEGGLGSSALPGSARAAGVALGLRHSEPPVIGSHLC